MRRIYQSGCGFENYRPDKEIERRLHDEYAQRFSDACGAEKHSVDLSPLRLGKRVESVIHGFLDSTRSFALEDIEGPPENPFFEDERTQRSNRQRKSNARGRKRLKKFILSKKSNGDKAPAREDKVAKCKHGILAGTCSLCIKVPSKVSPVAAQSVG
jgi:hypothetical protein